LGNPLEGVTVAVKEGSAITTTDVSGNYRITVVGTGSILKFTILGYDSVEKTLGDKTVVNVSLKVLVNDLDEVVVVGYGEVRRRDLTGSVSSVQVEDNVSRQFNSVDALLQGRAAGVQVNSNAGN